MCLLKHYYIILLKLYNSYIHLCYIIKTLHYTLTLKNNQLFPYYNTQLSKPA